MIRYEDYELEKRLFENDSRMIIPIEIKEVENRCEIFTYKMAEDVAQCLACNYRNNLFSKECISFVDSSLRARVTELGYIPDKRVNSYIFNFISGEIKKELILPTTAILYDADEYLDRTGILQNNENDEFPYFATVLGKEIVSACGVNARIEELTEVEINITTAPSFRAKGYGASNVMAMTQFLTRKGYTVTYNCSATNEKSKRVAEKCGFKLVGKSYYYICYKEE